MRTWAEIDRRLYQGQATVLTVKEVQDLVREHGVSKAAEQVDVVVTATFAPVSWALLFFRPAANTPGHWAERAWLGGIPLQVGFHPAQMLLEASATGNRGPQRGGAHLLEAWLSGERLVLRLQFQPGAPSAQSAWEGGIGLSDLEEARLLVVLRSAGQGLVAVNGRPQPLPSELGLLLPEMGNAAHTWMGCWEPGVLDPAQRAILPGLPILLAGSVGQVAWRQGPAIALSAGLHSIRREYLRALAIPNYGVGLAVGVAWPVPVLDPQALAPLEDPETRLTAELVDYAAARRPLHRLGEVSYGALLQGTISVAGRPVPVTSLSSPTRAVRLAEELKARLLRREFPPLSPPTLTEEIGP